jgi:hypothetical protein
VRSENGWLELITMLIFEFDNIERRTKIRLVFFQVECWPFDLKQHSLHVSVRAYICSSELFTRIVYIRTYIRTYICTFVGAGLAPVAVGWGCLLSSTISQHTLPLLQIED